MPYATKEKVKEYNKKYHIRTWQARKEKHRILKARRRLQLAVWLRTYKKNLSCVTCNENHPACLDFHHLDKTTKEGTVSNMISEGYSIELVQKEIDKCIILCKNCHAKEHYDQNQSDNTSQNTLAE